MAQWINRMGARTMWLVGYIVFATASITNVFLQDVELMIYVARSGLLLGAAIVFASGLTYVSQTSPEHRRTEAIGVFGIGGFLGMLIGPLMGDLFLGERERANFVVLFLVAAGANVLPAMGVFLLRDTDRHGRGKTARLTDFIRVVRRHWPGMILLVDLAFGVCMTTPFIFVASFIDHASLRIPKVSVIGLFFFCYAGLGIVVRLWSRRVPDRIGARRVLLVGMCFMSLGMLSFSWVTAERTWFIVIPALLTGIGHSLMFHTMTSLTLEKFPSEVRGTGSALALMMLDLGTIAGAPVLGMIGERYGYAVLFGAIGTFCFAVALAYAASRVRVAASGMSASLDPLRKPDSEET
jgi:MFS family permease